MLELVEIRIVDNTALIRARKGGYREFTQGVNNENIRLTEENEGLESIRVRIEKALHFGVGKGL